MKPSGTLNSRPYIAIIMFMISLVGIPTSYVARCASSSVICVSHLDQKVVGPPTPARPSRPVHADGGTRKLCLSASSVELSCSAMPASPASISSTRVRPTTSSCHLLTVSVAEDLGDRRPGPSPESGGHRRRLPVNSNTQCIPLSVAIHSLRHPTACAQTL